MIALHSRLLALAEASPFNHERLPPFVDRSESYLATTRNRCAVGGVLCTADRDMHTGRMSLQADHHRQRRPGALWPQEVSADVLSRLGRKPHAIHSVML